MSLLLMFSLKTSRAIEMKMWQQVCLLSALQFIPQSSFDQASSITTNEIMKTSTIAYATLATIVLASTGTVAEKTNSAAVVPKEVAKEQAGALRGTTGKKEWLGCGGLGWGWGGIGCGGLGWGGWGGLGSRLRPLQFGMGLLGMTPRSQSMPHL